MSALGWVGLLLAAAAPASDTRPPAPHAGCVDARQVTEARHLDERAVLLRTAEAGYRVELAETCPPGDAGDLVALAPHGWVCGGEEEYVRAGGRVCAIASVAALNERDWAVALREHAKRGGTTTLGAVTVEAKVAPRRRFAASTEYCVDPRRVRGWNVSGREIVLKTMPRRGTREATSYRLELGRSCPEADLGSDLTLVSGVGIGWICGHPGDRAMIASSVNEASSLAVMDLQGALLQPSILTAGFASEGCPIVAVYPVR
jgi:hypothetical protein